jgi:hypothetical protein
MMRNVVPRLRTKLKTSTKIVVRANLVSAKAPNGNGTDFPRRLLLICVGTSRREAGSLASIC